MTLTRIDLDGLDGSNPLAFLAALGTVRTLDPGASGDVRLGWSERAGAWRPYLLGRWPASQDALLAALAERLAGVDGRVELRLGADHDNLDVSRDEFRGFVEPVARRATRDDRRAADFAAAFGCEAVARDGRKDNKIEDTALRTMSGAGHQHFLGTMRALVKECTADHLRKALFEPWRYDDPLRGLSLRWEPTEDRRHAYQWTDPTDNSQRTTGSVLGANRLAVEALPFFPTAPLNRGRRTVLATTGFRRTPEGEVQWTWPIWAPAIPASVIASVLALPELQRSVPPAAELRSRGIVAVYRSIRVSSGYFRNFTPATAV